MRKAAYYSMGVVLLVWTGLTLGVTLQEDPPRTLVADTMDLYPITFTIINSGGDPAIPDVTVSGAESGDGTYLDINIIIGRAGSGDTIAVAIEAATGWDLTGLNSGTVTIDNYNGIIFSAIDNLYGGLRDDTYVFDADVALGTIAITEFPGGGMDSLDFSLTTIKNLNVDLSSDDPHVVVTGNLTIDLSAGDVIENVIGGSENDIITGNSLDNAITGGPGKDTLDGSYGVDTVIETRDADFTLTNQKLTIGSENDTLMGIEAAVLTGGPGNNTLNASSFTGSVVLDGAGGNDTLTGGSGDDVLIGGPGDDTLTGRGGNDEYRGGPGTNTITEGATGGDDTVVEICDGDFTLTDTGQLSWSDGTDGYLVNIENVHLIGGTGDNQFDISALADSSISVEGSEGYDTLILGPEGISVDLVTAGIIVPGFQSVDYMTVEAVIIDGDAFVSADATLNAREYYLDSLIVKDNSVLTLASDISATEFQGVKITTSSDLTIEAGSHISADGQGYAAGQGPGAGETATVDDSSYGGGGGYGGQGGNGEAGALGGGTYGSFTEPTDLGSGGGNVGGVGGGAIWLVVDGTLLLDGGLVCQGDPGDYQAGGGAGGSIYITAGTLNGVGTISADGGYGGESGGGGGGRIALYFDTDTFTGTITASGGVGFEPGGDGTIYPWYILAAAEGRLEQSIAVVSKLAVTDFANARSGVNALINKLEATIALIEAGLYQDALMKLQHDILPKMDGCASTGEPDKNDWIITCEAQQILYPLVLEAIQLLQSLNLADVGLG